MEMVLPLWVQKKWAREQILPQLITNLFKFTYFYTNLGWVNTTVIFHSKLQIIKSCSQHFSFLCNYFISSMTELTTLKAQLIQTTVLQQLQYSCRRLHYYNLDIARGTSQSVTMWLRVISLSERQPLSAMVSSNSSWSICSTFLTPASPSAANENTTGLPIWSSCRGTKQNENIFLWTQISKLVRNFTQAKINCVEKELVERSTIFVLAYFHEKGHCFLYIHKRVISYI